MEHVLVSAKHFDCQPGSHGLFIQLDVLKTSQTHNVPEVQGGFWGATIFQNFDFWGAQSFLRYFFSPSFRWVLPCGFCLGLAAPEAGHLCTWQPSTATTPWRSGSWRRRRPWMHRAMAAVASEEDLGREILLRDGIPLWGEVDEDVDGSSFWWILFSQFIGKFAKTFAPMFGVVLCEHKYIVTIWCILFSVFVEKISQTTFAPTLGVFLVAFTFSAPLLFQCTDKTCSIDDFSLIIFWSDHCSPKLVTNFQHHVECTLTSRLLRAR